MKVLSLILPVVIVCGSSGLSPAEATERFRATQSSFDCSFRLAAAAQPKPAAGPADLDSVLKKMDAVADTFRSAQATFEWDTYEKVIDEVDDYETGVISYRRTGKEKEIEMMAEVKMAGPSLQAQKPEPKFVLYSGEKVRMYQPKIDTVTEIDLSKHTDFAGYVVLGFGGSGQDLQKVFDVTYAGSDTVNGVATAKLQLVPKSEKARNIYKQILLWIDMDKGISVQQQFFAPDGNYRLTKYTNIQVNGKKIPDEVFKLKTTSKTQVVSPKG